MMNVDLELPKKLRVDYDKFQAYEICKLGSAVNDERVLIYI